MLHLASRSPRRHALLARLGLPFGVIDLDLPERRASGEPAADYVRRVAREKAGAGLLRMVAVPDALVIGADTEVVLDDEVFGKPRDAAEAAAMLRRLSNRTHQVMTAVALVSAGREAQALSVSEVRFAALDEADIAAYVAGGEPMGKAGGYAIQGGAERFVAHLSGSYSSVMGLPLYETAELLRGFGIVARSDASSPDSCAVNGSGEVDAMREPRPALALASASAATCDD
ncbi:MAG: Maf family nucleotide pyrophosphatase [Pseudomonadota bacterium]|nr:Maf family nucleotide pyrophosphatase [Pseudomonadota bacterium]